ncbi:MAG: NAD-dependent deacylase [Gemmatimonadales bacterium]|nr:NAD-dependent deacylase [Gemmatimonadales bacterium]
MSDAQETPPGVVRFAGRLRAARHLAVLTGAGVSAESGLPTFRDPLTGLWARYRPQELATPEAFAGDPALVWSWYRMRRDAARAAMPNPAHLAIARLESLVPRVTLITQNVDGLHRRAGSSDPIELHGSLFGTRCTREGTVHEGVVDRELEAGRLPRCPDCGALLRPGVVWFGEILPADALRRAQTAASECDVFLSVGTSHQVYPAAGLPGLAASAGAAVAVIDPSPSGPGGVCRLTGKAGEVLPALLTQAWPGAAPQS